MLLNLLFAVGEPLLLFNTVPQLDADWLHSHAKACRPACTSPALD
jgi:hypothetical protein